MGYMLSSLAELPVDDEVDLYIFVVDEGWQSESHDLIEKNFARVAREIGTKAVIAKGLNEQLWTAEVCQKYLGKDYGDLLSLIPAFLITDAHPDNLNDNSMRLLASLIKVRQQFGNYDAFFTLLTRFARNQDRSFIDLFQKRESVARTAAGMLELKPNFCGVGVNLNAVIDRFFSNSTQS